MCGIAGVFDARLAADDYGPVLRRMADALRHRGPDQEGAIVVPALRAGLACRRLSLVDVANGRQPIANEDGSVHVALNGEIYDHASLGRTLTARGHRLRTASDTEVVAHLYEDRGVECLRELRGMFGLAVLDARAGRLVLARDPAGMRGLYWTVTAAGLLFASEVTALVASGLVPREPDEVALRYYLAVGFVPSPLTGFRGIAKLAPGSWLVADAQGIRGGRFWEPRFRGATRADDGEPGTDAAGGDPAAALDARLAAAVRTHLAADVPIGAYVSGGWDSSLVAAHAARAAGGRLKTFSIVFPEDPAVDERRFARRIAAHLDAEHHEIEFRAADVAGLLPAAIRHVEEPNTRDPFLLQYQLARLAAGHVKAVVSGEGSDELFGGYRWLRNRAIDAGESLRRVLPPALARRLAGVVPSHKWRRMMRFAGAPDDDALQVAWLRELALPVHRNLLTPECDGTPLDPTLLVPAPASVASCGTRLERRLLLEMVGRLGDGLLLPGDKVSMAHGLEVRMPFLDHGVVDFALALPAAHKIRYGRPKAILRPLVRELPPEIAARRKVGLGYPPRLWRASTDAFFRGVLLESPSPAPFVDRRALGRWLARHEAPPTSDGRRERGSRLSLWPLVVLQCWWNAFFDGG